MNIWDNIENTHTKDSFGLPLLPYTNHTIVSADCCQNGSCRTNFAMREQNMNSPVVILNSYNYRVES